jgi:integrase
MSARHGDELTIWAMQDRRKSGTPRPWVVRWRIGSRKCSRAFKNRVAAADFEAQLRVAAANGERFDRETGLPASWSTSSFTVAEWAHEWLHEGDRWSGWTPRTRKGHVEALSRWIPLLTGSRAPEMPPALAAQLADWLTPGRTGNFSRLESWLRRHSLLLGDLTKENVARAVEQLSIGKRGGRNVPVTTHRYRRTTKVHFSEAERRGLVAVGLWPPTPPKTKKSSRGAGPAVRRELLPSLEVAVAAVDGIRSHQPASHGYHALTACVLYAGMRPSEAHALDIEKIDLPEEGWGVALVDAAVQDQAERWGNDEEQVGDTKTAESREVPLPPPLVAILRAYIGERTTGPLVVTRHGNRPTYSNWSRAWDRGRRSVGGAWTLYDLRHTAATTMVDNGVPLGEAARRLGHTVETLVRTYIGVLDSHRALGDELMGEVWERALADTI